MKAVLTILILLFTASSAYATDVDIADNTSVRIVKAEKDTLIATHNGQTIRIRLLGLQCPSKRAAKLSSKLVRGKKVSLRSDKAFLPILMDNHNRYVAYVEFDNGKDLGMELVESGLCEGASWKSAHPKKRFYAAAR